MQRTLAVVLLLAGLAAGCNRQPAATLDPDIARFIAAKRQQLKQTAAAQTNGLPNTVWGVLDAAERNDFNRTTNLFAQVHQETGRVGKPGASSALGRRWQDVQVFLGLRPKYWPGLDTEAWSPIQEVIGISEVYHTWDHKWMRRYGRDIIDSVPSNSIYFGGTDGGRFIVSALSDSQATGQPFFTLTQNQLADRTYLDYLQFMYGNRIQIPTATDSQQAFQDYLIEAQRRKEANQLKVGENVQITSGRVQVSGQTAVMEINGLLAYNIFTNNPGREFFVEESFPLDWMYPHLSPHGLILKLNREPLAELSAEVVRRDHEFWSQYAKELIGDWLTPETSVEAVCEFSRKVYLNKDLDGFAGDADYARNREVQRAYAKLRMAIAEVYACRALARESQAPTELMNAEADFAFKQAVALGPVEKELAERFTRFLTAQGRNREALEVAWAYQAFDRRAVPARELIQLIQAREANSATNQPAGRPQL